MAELCTGLDGDTQPSTIIRAKQRMIVAHHGVVWPPADGHARPMHRAIVPRMAAPLQSIH
jgi:hypothetical protein